MLNSPEAKPIWNVVQVVKITRGLIDGLQLFIWAPFFYMKFGGKDDPHAMLFVAILIALESGLLAILEVPTGAIADVIGRKRTTLVSLGFDFLYFITLALIVLVKDIPLAFSAAIIAVICSSLSFTFFSGTFTAWSVDALRERAPHIPYVLVLSRGHLYTKISLALGAMAGIFFFTNDLMVVPFLFSAAIIVGCITYCSSAMEESKTLNFLHKSQITVASIFKKSGEIMGTGFQICRGTPVLLILIGIYASTQFLSSIVNYMWPVYLQTQLQFPKNSYYVVALLALLMGGAGAYILNKISGRSSSGKKSKDYLLSDLFLWVSLFGGLAVVAHYLLVSQFGDTVWYFSGTILFIQCSGGFLYPIYETLINHNIAETDSQARSTVLSWGSMFPQLFSLFLIIPAIGKTTGNSTAGWLVPAGMVIIASLYGMYWVWVKKPQKIALLDQSE